MLSSKDFNDKLQLKNFEELESDFQQAKDFFENLDGNIHRDEVSEKFPAFIYNNAVNIKFPTFKVRITNSRLSQKELYSLLSEYSGFTIYDEANVVSFPALKPVQSTAIHCLEKGLKENTMLAEHIMTKLREKCIFSERCVDSGIFLIPIVIDESGYLRKA